MDTDPLPRKESLLKLFLEVPLEFDKGYCACLHWTVLERLPRNPESLIKTDLQWSFPTVLVRSGKAVCLAADEFFSARILPPTGTAYAQHAGRFLT
jgi:hypothetical protein